MKNEICRLARLLVALLSPAYLLAQDLPTAAPAEVGLSPQRLERIGVVMQEHVERGDLVGAVAMLARRGKLAYLESWGMRDREAAQPMTPDAIFRIYSMTKPVTSVAVLMLYQDGRFLLSDPISKYLPDWKEPEVLLRDGINFLRVRAQHPITIRDLLSHTSGLTYGSTDNPRLNLLYRESGSLERDRPLAEIVTRLAGVPLAHEPGTHWEYGMSSDVLGHLVESVSGLSLDRFFEQRIFGPLGMKDTGFYVPSAQRGRLAQSYGFDSGGKLSPVEAGSLGPVGASPVYLSPGGGLVSTAPDYLRFCQMLLGGGELEGIRLLSPKTVELMRSDRLGDIPVIRSQLLRGLHLMEPGYGFGLGVAVSRGPGPTGAVGSAGEYNWGGAAGTLFWIDPRQEMVGIFMVQIRSHPDLTYGSQFKALAYQAIEE